MAKKNVLFCVTLLCSAMGSLVSSKIVANQDLTNIEAENTEEAIQQSMDIIEQTYQAAIKSYDKDAIEKYEQDLNDSMTEYFMECAQDKSCAANTENIEQQLTDMVQDLSAVTNEDHAYATSYAIFMVTISKVIDAIEDKIQEENLTEAVKAIGKIVEDIFLSRLGQQDADLK